MKICGVEIKSNKANLVILDWNDGNINLINTSVKSITLNDSNSQSDIESFKTTILDFFTNHNIDLVAIKQRTSSGNFGASGLSFKIEALIQLYDKEVKIVNSKTIDKILKGKQINNFNVLQYQKGALETALSEIYK
jgi:hypothetical protein